jgi:hypothetical protein
LFFAFSISCAVNCADKWTWLITKKVAAEDIQGNRVLVERKKVPGFSQLIVSWNAERPAKGYFRFMTQVKDAATQKWGEWHKAHDWGAGIQQSYFSSSGVGGSKNHHVRLEMPFGRLADGLRIKVEARGGALISSLKEISGNIANLKAFIPERQNDLHLGLSSVDIPNVPMQSQMVLDHEKAKVMCSPTSCAMALGYINKGVIDPVHFAESAYDNGLQAYGSWPFNVAHAFERSNGKAMFRVCRLNSFIDLHKQLTLQRPVVVSVRGALKGAPQAFPKGHFVLVVGYDNETQSVVCHDPSWDSNEKVRASYDLSSFLQAWGRSHNLAYTMEPRSL